MGCGMSSCSKPKSQGPSLAPRPRAQVTSSATAAAPRASMPSRQTTPPVRQSTLQYLNTIPGSRDEPTGPAFRRSIYEASMPPRQTTRAQPSRQTSRAAMAQPTRRGSRSRRLAQAQRQPQTQTQRTAVPTSRQTVYDKPLPTRQTPAPTTPQRQRSITFAPSPPNSRKTIRPRKLPMPYQAPKGTHV